MSRLTELIRQAKQRDPALGSELEREYRTLSGRRAFGLNFERHRPEAVELPSRQVRRGDKVRVLPPRGSTEWGDQRLWRVARIEKADGERLAHLEPLGDDDRDSTVVAADDLVVVAEFRDPIHPGLVSTGGVRRGGDKPAHTVINGENFHVLKALTYTHRGKVDAIYIDPPYNTGAKDWKYNNDYVEGDDLYRHSKWLAFMERRLLLAKELLNPDNSVLIVTIDEKEYLRLGLLLEQSFPEAAIQMVSTLINPAGGARSDAFGRSDEYLFFVAFGAAAPQRVRLSRDWVSGRGRTHTGSVRWDLLRRSGTAEARREDRPGCFYPVYIDPNGPSIAEVGEPLPTGVTDPPVRAGLVALLPIRKDGTEGRWQWGPDTLRKRIPEGRVRVSGSATKGFVLSTLKDGEFAKVQRGEFKVLGRGPDESIQVESVSTDTVLAVPHTQWRIASHDATQYGTRLLASFIPGKRFPFPKSLYAVEDALRFFVSDKPDAVVIDFFAGSGTTAHAVMRLNKQDGGQRQCISVTNNEVSADEQRRLRQDGLRPGDADWEALGICDHITKPRIEAAVTGRTPEGDPVERHGDTETPLPRYRKHMLADDDRTFPLDRNEWEAEVLDREQARPGFVGWYRNPSRSSQDSLAIVYEHGGRMRTVRPDFVFFTKNGDGTIGASIVDPHGHHLGDALPKLRGLAIYAEHHGERYQRIDAITKIGDTLRVLDLTEPSVRSAVADATDAATLYQGDHAADY